VQNETTVQEN